MPWFLYIKGTKVPLRSLPLRGNTFLFNKIIIVLNNDFTNALNALKKLRFYLKGGV
jgi:hypothetical protein